MSKLAIPPILHDIWPRVMALQPNECLVLLDLGTASKQYVLSELRKARRASEKAGLLHGYGIVFRPVRGEGSTWCIYIQKVGIPSVEHVAVPEEGGDSH